MRRRIGHEAATAPAAANGTEGHPQDMDPPAGDNEVTPQDRAQRVAQRGMMFTAMLGGDGRRMPKLPTAVPHQQAKPRPDDTTAG